MPADSAEKSLKRLAKQSGREVLFSADVVERVQTRAVRGEMTPKQALDAMLDGTVLVGVQDERNGSITVRLKRPTADAKKKNPGQHSSGTMSNNPRDNPPTPQQPPTRTHLIPPLFRKP